MNEYAVLAQRVGLIVDDVHGCLVLSRDGLVLAAFPEDHEDGLKPAWLRFVQMGEVRKAFVEFGDQIWAFVHRGPYAAFVVAGTTVRPGVLLDQLEQVLLAAEASRASWEPLKLSDAHAAPSGKPRAPLHPPTERTAPAEPVPVVVAETTEDLRQAVSERERMKGKDKEKDKEKEKKRDPVVADGGGAPVPSADAERRPPPAIAGEAAAPTFAGPAAGPPEGPAAPAADTPLSTLKREPQKLVGDAGNPPEEGGEIDRVLLAKEFSGLLQMDSDGDEASG